MEVPFLVGERYYLRKLTEEDINDRYLSWMQDPTVTEFLAPIHQPHTIESLKEYWRLNQRSNTYFLAIIDRETDTHIGNVRLDIYDSEKRFAELGMLVGEKAFWGKSCMYDVYGMLIEYGFVQLKLKGITVGAESSHIASIITFKKLGFKLQTKLENHYQKNGKSVDVFRFILEANDYSKCG
ncbi:MAG: GNAT family N-acetyltransferase [Candidatus Omnitrophica bacterium]|nr:GNAT family N-acetyltransferase [Candidatus Omnitrophota bacterium]